MTSIKPPVKWVGGKAKLWEKLFQYFPKSINNYHEMFLGGGSVLLGVLTARKNNELSISGKIYAYDSNSILIAFYKQLQTDYKSLYKAVNDIKNKTSDDTKKYYYLIRDSYNNRKEVDLLKVAEFLYLNKTCFRGIFRLNKSGGFNVPYGNYKNPKIVDEEHLRKISELIKDVEFICCDFENITNIQENDFVYLDPPYVPEKKGSFVSYSKDGFTEKKHNALFKLCLKMRAKFVMSNSNTALVREQLKKFTIVEIDARRAINSKNPAAKTKEVIISNL